MEYNAALLRDQAMSQFLETLKTRMDDSQKRLQVAQQKLQVAQVEYQSVAQEFASWQNAVNVEMHKEEREAAGTVLPPRSEPPGQSAPSTTDQRNKTELVRELLRQNPMGIAPVDLWRKLEGQIANRVYLYSVLKRLKDRGEAIERRGKYFTRMVPPRDQNKEQTVAS